MNVFTVEKDIICIHIVAYHMAAGQSKTADIHIYLIPRIHLCFSSQISDDFVSFTFSCLFIQIPSL